MPATAAVSTIMPRSVGLAMFSSIRSAAHEAMSRKTGTGSTR